MNKIIQYQWDGDDESYAQLLVGSRQRSTPKKATAELEGALAEVIFAKVFGLPLPEVVQKKGDGGVDFTFPSGASVDVKSISGDAVASLGLLVPKRIRAGLYVLIELDMDDRLGTILGYQTGGYAASYGEEKYLHYRLDRKVLRPAGELYGHMEARSPSAL